MEIIGIITNAQNANILSSVAQLQDFFDQYYVEHYNELENATSKVEGIKSKNNSWFYSTADGYVIDASGHAVYLLVKENLIRDYPELASLRGGDAGNKTYNDYYSMNDVYGVTKNLKVYYCEYGSSSIVGIKENELDNENLNRIAISNSDALASLIPHTFSDGVTLSELRNQEELTIDENVDLEDCSQFYRLTSLKTLNIKNKTGEELSLTGIENANQLNYICFYNCSLSNYLPIKGISKLTYLYLYRSNNSEVEKVFTAMQGVDYNNLQYLGIFGETVTGDYSESVTDAASMSNFFTNNDSKEFISSVTDISKMSLLTTATKNSINYLFLNNNKISSLTAISDFVNVKVLALWRNQLESLEPLSELVNIRWLGIQHNLGITSLEGVNSKNISSFNAVKTNIESVGELDGCECLRVLVLRENTSLRDVSTIKNLGGNLARLYLAGCPNLDGTTVRAMASVYNKVGTYWKSIDPEFEEFLTTDDIQNLSGKVSSDEDAYEKLFNSVDLLKLNLASNVELGNTTFTDLSTDIQLKILEKLGNKDSSRTKDAYFRYILSSLTGITHLSLKGISNLTSVDFVEFMPDIQELDITGTSITDLSFLESLINNSQSNRLVKFSALAIDNSNIDLTKIQNVISRVSNMKYRSYWTYVGDNRLDGLYIGNANLLTNNGTSLNDCKNVQTLNLQTPNKAIATVIDLTGMTALKTYTAQYVHAQVKLPPSVEYVATYHAEYELICGTESTPSRLTYLNHHDSNETTQAKFTELLQSMRYCQKTTEIEILFSNVTEPHSLTGISALKDLKISKFQLGAGYNEVTDISDLANLSGGTGYIDYLYISSKKTPSVDYAGVGALPNLSGVNIKQLTITLCKLSDISGISGNTYVEEINFSKNAIQNLSALSNLSNLKRLTLNNNNIYNRYEDVENEVVVYNLDILYKLNSANTETNNSLVYVNLSENHLEETIEYTKVVNSFGSDSIW